MLNENSANRNLGGNKNEKSNNRKKSWYDSNL